MSSVFKELIKKEFGVNSYDKYFFICQKSLENRKLENKEIYNDIYEHIKNKDQAAIKNMQKDIHPMITVISLILMSVSFIVKTYEYLINKYCFIDAHIVLVYKTVLDRVILIKELEQSAFKKS
ncbi:MAG: hypothetical protein K0S18_1505 [Anaerocolumna sp.]|nr:hypothetical protein [Anaerocolumna sp.]